MTPFARISNAFKEVLFPSKCLACGRFFYSEAGWTARSDLLPAASTEVFEKIMAPFLCPDCRSAFYPITSPKCPLCGEMFKSRAGDDHICGDCLKGNNHFNFIRSAGQYAGAFMTLIHAYKYKQKMQLARPLGRLLFHTFLSYPELAGPDMIVPVPLHSTRLKKRGFNQATLLVAQWPALFKQSGGRQPDIDLNGNVLARIRKTPAQTGLDRAHRRLNIRHAFACDPKAAIQGKNMLLIDDVCTTGATVNECAGILKKAGADGVNVLTLARAA